MSDNQARGGLSEVHDQIEGLMSDLDSTLELIKGLSERGEGEAALTLIDAQRAELYKVVNSLSRDVAASDRGWGKTLRRRMVTAAAAALVAVSALAVSVQVLNRSDPVTDATAQLTRAAAIDDPSERLRVIIRVYEVTRALPNDRAGEVDDQLLKAIEHTAPEVAEDPEGDQSLVVQAEQAAADIQAGREPTPPSPPSSEKGPVDETRDTLGL